MDCERVAGAAPRWALTAEASNDIYSGSLYTFFLNTTLEKVNFRFYLQIIIINYNKNIYKISFIFFFYIKKLMN